MTLAMTFDRRDLLRALAGSVAFAPAAVRAGARPLAALLLPLTGPGAGLGRSLDRAARLAAGGDAARLIVLDSGATPASAAAAAATARRRHAPLIIGPVYGAQVAATVAAAREIPVLALTNDPGGGGFVMGITPAQSAGAILSYARSRGARRIALAAGAGQWDRLVADAAHASARDLDLALVEPAAADAILVAGDAAALAAVARGSGAAQLLGTPQAIDASPAALAAIDGAWLAAPDPAGFGDFTRRFETAYGAPPGLLAGLAYDAVGIARTLDAGAGLLGAAGFAGVTGTVRFAAGGRATRDLAIVVAEGGRLRAVGRGEG